MADTPKVKAPKSKTVVYTGATLAGVGVLYYLYKHYQSTGSLNPFSSGTGTTGDTTTPADTTPATTTVGTSTAPVFGGATTLAQWKTQILDYATNTYGIQGGENIAATGLAAALSGHCVGPNEYAALNAALGAVGQPPGGTIIRLQQCPKAATPTTTTTHTPTSTPTKAPVKTPAKAPVKTPTKAPVKTPAPPAPAPKVPVVKAPTAAQKAAAAAKAALARRTAANRAAHNPIKLPVPK